jgi:hypothetical protein
MANANESAGVLSDTFFTFLPPPHELIVNAATSDIMINAIFFILFLFCWL